MDAVKEALGWGFRENFSEEETFRQDLKHDWSQTAGAEGLPSRENRICKGLEGWKRTFEASRKGKQTRRRNRVGQPPVLTLPFPFPAPKPLVALHASALLTVCPVLGPRTPLCTLPGAASLIHHQSAAYLPPNHTVPTFPCPLTSQNPRISEPRGP